MEAENASRGKMNRVKLAPQLYVSGYQAARRFNDHYRICVSDSNREARFADSHYPIDEDDLPDTFIQHARHVAAEAIQKIEEGRKVLIYCHAGRNRSVSCCVYLLSKYTDMTFSEVLQRVRSLHSEVSIMDEIMDFLQYRFSPSPPKDKRKKHTKKHKRRTSSPR